MGKKPAGFIQPGAICALAERAQADGERVMVMQSDLNGGQSTRNAPLAGPFSELAGVAALVAFATEQASLERLARSLPVLEARRSGLRERITLSLLKLATRMVEVHGETPDRWMPAIDRLRSHPAWRAFRAEGDLIRVIMDRPRQDATDGETGDDAPATAALAHSAYHTLVADAWAALPVVTAVERRWRSMLQDAASLRARASLRCIGGASTARIFARAALHWPYDPCLSVVCEERGSAPAAALRQCLDRQPEDRIYALNLLDDVPHFRLDALRGAGQIARHLADQLAPGGMLFLGGHLAAAQPMVNADAPQRFLLDAVAGWRPAIRTRDDYLALARLLPQHRFQVRLVDETLREEPPREACARPVACILRIERIA
jgi:hypothetical protein